MTGIDAPAAAGSPEHLRFTLRLRPLRPEDGEAFAAIHRTMATEGFNFGIGYAEDQPWTSYLARLEAHRMGLGLTETWVPATFLVADVDGEMIGRTSVRHELNPQLAHVGGHIGFGVAPDHRGQGYGTEILHQSLVVARAVGIGDVLVTCDDDNWASAKVIERCGGSLESVVRQPQTGQSVRRYWIR